MTEELLEKLNKEKVRDTHIEYMQAINTILRSAQNAGEDELYSILEPNPDYSTMGDILTSHLIGESDSVACMLSKWDLGHLMVLLTSSLGIYSLILQAYEHEGLREIAAAGSDRMHYDMNVVAWGGESLETRYDPHLTGERPDFSTLSSQFLV